LTSQCRRLRPARGCIVNSIVKSIVNVVVNAVVNLVTNVLALGNVNVVANFAVNES
jgi:hypothetical protein